MALDIIRILIFILVRNYRYVDNDLVDRDIYSII